MDEPLENLYFNWLCAKVTHVENPSPSNVYWRLLRTLHNTEYVWLVTGDDNRAEDGIELRDEFMTQSNYYDDPEEFRGVSCSLLEMLIAFSRRAEFMTTQSAKDWFWEFIDNIGLLECTDASELTEDDIGERLYSIIWRTYDPAGRGGLFPMSDPPEDQRKTEIWYQFCEYLIDHDKRL